MDYIVDRISLLEDDVVKFLNEEVDNIASLFGNKFNPENCAIESMVHHGIFLVCRRKGEVTGLHISWLYKSPLDLEKKILQQQIFYVKPGSGHTAYHLFQKFIDIGKNEADHVITMLTGVTNIKPETLNKLGFKELETLYRMEIK